MPFTEKQNKIFKGIFIFLIILVILFSGMAIGAPEQNKIYFGWTVLGITALGLVVGGLLVSPIITKWIDNKKSKTDETCTKPITYGKAVEAVAFAYYNNEDERERYITQSEINNATYQTDFNTYLKKNP